jgi:membrane protease YdiL (CAAX protease family)
MYMVVRDTNFASLSTILQLYFETVLTVGYFLFSIGLGYLFVLSRSVVVQIAFHS